MKKSPFVVALVPLFAATLVVAQGTAPAPAPAATPAAPAATPAAPATAKADAATGGTETGKVNYYGKKFAGHKTASGERYDPNALTMAHKTLPFGTKVKVTNKANGKTAELRVNDRGPKQEDRIGDVSLAAAKQLGFGKAGTVEVDIVVVSAPAAKK